MRLRALAALLRPTAEAPQSAFARANFDRLLTLHRAAMAAGIIAPVLLLVDPACPLGREIVQSPGVELPDGADAHVGPCVAVAAEHDLLAGFAASSAEKIVELRRAVRALPQASDASVRVAVVMGGDVTLISYTTEG